MFVTNKKPIAIINDTENPDHWHQLYVIYSPKDDLYYISLNTNITKNKMFIKTYYKFYTIDKDKIVKFLKLAIILNKCFPTNFNKDFIDLLLIRDLFIKPYFMTVLEFNIKEEKLYENK